MALTAKQKLFVKEYLVDLNATQSAIRAGYSTKTAEAIGYENLRKPQIAQAIEKAMGRREQRTEITQDRVLQELAKIGFANISDYLKVNTAERVIDYKEVEGDEGNISKVPVFGMVQSVEVFDTDGVDRIKLDAVAEIKETRDGISVKLHDKVAALEKIGRHLGMFNDKLKLEGEVKHQHNHSLRNLSPKELADLERIIAKTTDSG